MIIKDIAIDLYIDFFNKVLRKNALSGYFVNKNQTISEILNTRKSVIRFGDGESSIYFGYDLSFQVNENNLSNRLRSIFNRCICDNRFIFCMTHERFSCNIKSMFSQKINRYNVWKKSRYLYISKVRNEKCFDAYVFKGLEFDQYISIVNKISNFEKIIVVSSISNSVANFFDYYSYAGDVIYIDIPEKNSYSRYKQTMQEAMKYIQECNQNNLLVILSCGPMAKVLCYDLTLKGITVYDVGKFFISEFPRFIDC